MWPDYRFAIETGQLVCRRSSLNYNDTWSLRFRVAPFVQTGRAIYDQKQGSPRNGGTGINKHAICLDGHAPLQTYIRCQLGVGVVVQVAYN